jgi:nitroreductase
MKTARAVFLSIILVAFMFSSFPLTLFSQQKSNVPDALTVIHSRKSVRKYLDKPVTKDQLEILLRAGMASPTAADKRPWAFVVVTGRAMLDTLSLSTRGTGVLKGAKAAIVVCGDTRKGLPSEVWIQDCSAASENILLAAEAIGLGAVWTGIWLNVEPTKYVKRVLGLPAEVQPLNILSIGYPTGEEKPKDKWDPTNIHYEKW